MPRGRLTSNQTRFTQLVASGMDEADAVNEAGYKTDNIHQILYKLNRNKRVQARIDMLRNKSKVDDVADRGDREAFWTSMMNDPANSGSVRLEASKLLGKAQGDFVIVQKVETDVKVNPVMVIPEVSPEEWEKHWEDNNGK